MNFFIPSYQRGYRWTCQQVKDLLDDIWSFKPEKIRDTESYTWYCLQPLVVKENLVDEKKRYDVIDGQQRLTTIFIILNCLEKSYNCLKYQTREDSSDFLKNINSKGDNDDNNIDYHFMLESKKTIESWRESKTKEEIALFVKKLKDNCKVIWYPISEKSDYDVFKRLNSGKLSLSNAELIKALLLNKENFRGAEDAIYLRQIEMAEEWDRIEQTLHNDSFWYFINPEPDSSKYKATRIDFIFEISLLSRKNDDGFVYNSVDDELKKDNNFIFNRYYEQCMNDVTAYRTIWSEIVDTFRIVNSWYNDRQLYHYVGYLMNQKGEKKVHVLQEILDLAKTKTKTKFLVEIKAKCADSILDGDRRDLESLSYFDANGKRNSKDCAIMHNILLLFNLATIQNQISENSRYPFDKHVKENWSLEHIHAKNEKRENVSSERIKIISKYLETSGNDDLAGLLWPSPRTNDPKEVRIDTKEYEALTKAFEGNKIIIDKSTNPYTINEKELNNIDDSWYQTSIRNMALLQSNKNSQFNNSYYPEKKVLLSKYEGNNKQDTKIEFVPICTRNAFFKHYSPNSNNPLCWDGEDGKNMLEAMVKNIAEYVGLEELGKLEDTISDSRIYGLKKKRDSRQ